jgi:integrase
VSAKTGHAEWGYIRRQRTKTARYQASFTGPDKRRHFAPMTFASKMNAQRWLAKEQDLIEKCAITGEPWKPPSARTEEKRAEVLTLSQYGKQVIEHRNLKARTKIGYEASFANYIEPKLGNVAVRDLNPAAVRAWFSSLGTATPVRNGHAYGLLNMICNTAIKDGLLQTNPCQIQRAMNPKTKRVPVVPTIAELEAITDKIGSEPRTERFRALVLISAWCGLRYGEVTALERQDFDSDCTVVTVRQGVTHRGGQCIVDTPKDGKPAKVVVPPHIRADIKSHLAQHVAPEPNALLFRAVRSECGHVNDRVFNKNVLKPVATGVGREKMSAHDLRHFAGTMTAQVGNLVETMARLRHSTHKASLIYQQQVSGRDIAVAEALSALRAEKIAEPNQSGTMVATQADS